MKKIILISMLILLLSACETSPTINPRSIVNEECSYLENIDDWQPVWCDEFDQDGLPDPSRWGYDVGGHGWGNQELQFYTQANLNNAFIEDGILNIRVIAETMGSNQYTSARLVSKYRGDWLYGRIQVRAKMPSGRGLWPAIWMLPTNWIYGDWPASGEIDIMEYVGYDPGIVHGTIHTGAFNHMMNTQIGFSRRVPTVEDAFHVYEMIWEPGKIELFIDGERYARFGFNPDTTIQIPNSDAWPFDDPFHLILNVAVGGTWGGLRGVDPSIFPQAMQVDYVRVYQRDYQALSQTPPRPITNPVVQRSTFNSVRFKWDALGEEIFSHVNIYANGEFVGKTTLNAFTVNGLTPDSDHVIEIEVENFNGQKSPKVTLNASTEPVRSIDRRIQAQAFDAMVGVRTEATEDTEGDLNVGWIDTGDYLEYQLEVKEAGTYQITYRVASLNGGGRIALLTRSRFPHTITEIPSTGGWQAWTSVTSETFNLPAGIFTFRLRADQGGFNLNYFDFTKVDE
jgi:beta-glucanase (GH16 family)